MDTFDIVLCVAAICISLVIFLGNILTIFAILTKPILQTASNQFILGLAIADLMVAISTPYNAYVTFELKDSDFDSYSDFAAKCLLSVVPVLFSCLSSNFNLILIAIERYFSICNPVAHRNFLTIRKARQGVGICFLLSAIAAILPVLWNNFPTNSKSSETCEVLTLKFEYYVYILLPTFIAAVLLILFAYTNIIKVALSKVANKSQAKKSLKMMMTILCCYCITWLPQMICLFLVLYSAKSPKIDPIVSDDIYAISFMLACCNSFMNPFIYAFNSKNFKEAFKQIIFRQKKSVQLVSNAKLTSTFSSEQMGSA
ncbi:adenosine receptor A1-like [Cloeon dipterum]|uniref:adenosine receptor A1-like n=1 Tax=Cloeon dipterum TaxID=197152 RepID=UPI00322006BD